MSNAQDPTSTGSFGYNLKKTQHALRLRMDEALRSLELTTPQYAVLAQTGLQPGISSAALARSAFITAQSMHGIVSNLEKRGLLTRKNDAVHGRILRAELTEQGRKMVAAAHDMIGTVEARMLATLSRDHRVLLEKLLLECFDNLHDKARG